MSAVVVFDGESAIDNGRHVLNVTCDPPSNSTFGEGDTVVTCSATDFFGNVGFCTFTVSISDTTNPVVTCPADMVVEYDYGNTTAVVVFGGESVTDNSGETLSATCDPPSNSTFGDGETVVTCSATDGAGNVGSCNFTITVEDTTPPMVTCPAVLAVEYDYGNTSAVVEFSGESATDNSGETPSVTCDPPSNSTFWDGINVVTCSATDSSGNTGACNFTITVQDTIAAVLTCPPDMQVEYDYGNTTSVVSFSGASAMDNSGQTLPVTCDPPSNSTFGDGQNVVTCSATDGSGNVGMCNFTITVQDTESPVVSCPVDTTVEVDYGNTSAVVEFSGETVIDNSGATLTATCDPPTNSTFWIGENEVTCSATDAAGNVGTCNFTVTVQDTMDPVVTCPANMTVEYDYGKTSAVVVFGGELVTDNSGETLSVTCDPPSNSTFFDGENVVTCSATDSEGNTGSCNFTITVEDTTKPILSCPSNITITNNYVNSSAVVVFSGEFATDNAGHELNVTCDPPSNSTFTIGETTVTCSATDVAGNVGTCTFIVNVTDLIGPMVTCPANITVENDEGNLTAVVTFSAESATDNSGQELSVTCDPPSNSVFDFGGNMVTCFSTDLAGNVGTCSFAVTVQVFGKGNTRVTCTATDFAGNQDTCRFRVTVRDRTNPVVTCPPSQTVELESGNTTIVSFDGESATDNSGQEIIVNCEPAANSSFPLGETVVTCYGIDEFNNVGTCDFVVTVEDTTDPVLTCPANLTVEYDFGNTTAVVTFNTSASDNSGHSLDVTCNPPSGSTFESGTTEVTCNSTDASDNEGSCSFNVTVQDTTGPMVICPENVTVDYDYGNTSAVVVFDGESAIDNGRDVLNVTCDPPSNSTFDEGDTVVTCSATDFFGNVGFCTFTVSISDTTNRL
ncbi:hyalin-like [Ptychodera flava]|uniref:hyalin-like n=1 Tax=Ptychodera flava TaxID=63121 RepID=UPI00396A9006